MKTRCNNTPWHMLRLAASALVSTCVMTAIVTAQQTAQPASQPDASTVPVMTVRASLNDEIVHMSPFEVTDERDHGYLRMNTATATRVGMEIQKVPLALTVISSDFIEDTGMRDIQDLMRYQPSASGDNRMGIVPPGNAATPRGTMTLRGFPVSQRLRNGVFRYTGYNMDNVERVEISRGPAAIFFGVGYPGGVINYVTKKAQFAKIPTRISYGYGGHGGEVGDQRVNFDQNTILVEDQLAMRLLATWNNIGGAKRDEFEKGFSISPSFVLKPFKNNKLVVTVEYEHTDFKRNIDDSTWTYNEQFFRDYNNPSNALLEAAGIPGGLSNPDWKRLWQTQGTGAVWNPATELYDESTRITYKGIGNLQPIESIVPRSYASGYGTWVTAMRKMLNNIRWSPNTQASRGAWYTNMDNKRVHDEEFNYYGPGSYTDQQVDVLEITVDLNPFDWLNVHYVYTDDNSKFSSLTNSASPMANGFEFNTAAPSMRGDYRHSMNHQLDLVFTKRFLGLNNRLLVGGLFNQAHQRYLGYGPVLYLNIPGAAEYNPSLPDNGTTNIPPWMNNYTWGLAWQTMKDRTGEKLTAYDLFARHDPSLHVRPDVSRITMPDRSIVDAGKPRSYEGYVSYMLDALKDRLHISAGYRWTFNYTNGGPTAASNPPWYNGYNFMYEAIDPAQWNAYGIGAQRGFTPYKRNPITGEYTRLPMPTNTEMLETYYQTQFKDQRGKSWMIGAGFDVTKDITVYASHSVTFRPQSAFGAIYSVDGVKRRAQMLGLDPDAEIARIRAGGADATFDNEEGQNTEVGVKTTLFNAKLVSTFSLFRLDRIGEALQDTNRLEGDPINYIYPNKGGAAISGDYDDPIFGKTSGVRWYSNGTKRRAEGAEIEVIWSPIRSFQMTASASWIWEAKTLRDTSVSDNPVTPEQKALYDYTYNYRMPGVSEYRANAFGNYTFMSGPLDGLAIGLGIRYASENAIANSADWDIKRGALAAGDYVVCDANLSYPWQVGRFKFVTSLNVTNLFDSEYCEGGGVIGISSGYNLAPSRVWLLSTSLSF